MYDVYRVTTCRPGRGHIVAASRLQLVIFSTAGRRAPSFVKNISGYLVQGCIAELIVFNVSI